jgi:hypothetical protein
MYYDGYNELLSKENLKDFILELIENYMDDEANIIVENNPFDKTVEPLIELYKKNLIEKALNFLK